MSEETIDYAYDAQGAQLLDADGRPLLRRSKEAWEALHQVPPLERIRAIVREELRALRHTIPVVGQIRQVIREEIEAHMQQGLDRLVADIHRTEPLSELQEIESLLVTMFTDSEWNALIERVNVLRSEKHL